MELIAENTMSAWTKSLKTILDSGIDFKDTDGRICREINNLSITINNISDYEKPIDIMQDFEWVYPTKEELSSIILNPEHNVPYEFSYGNRIFNFNGKDQANSFVIPLLQKDLNSRRAVIVFYNPAKDSNIESKNIPSLIYIYFRIINGKINAYGYIRSNDFFIGWPGNIYQMVILTKYIAERLSVELGSITTISSSAHVFLEHKEMIEKVLRK